MKGGYWGALGMAHDCTQNPPPRRSCCPGTPERCRDRRVCPRLSLLQCTTAEHGLTSPARYIGGTTKGQVWINEPPMPTCIPRSS